MYKVIWERDFWGACMEINLQFLFNIAVGAGLGIAGWFFRQLWDAVQSLNKSVAQVEKELTKDINDLEKILPVVYVRRDEFAEIMRDIKEMFNKINEKLDTKVDK